MALTAKNQSINNEDVEQQPLLTNADTQIEGNHNDPELSIQKTVYNLNNRNVRITLWCIIYMIFTTLGIQSGTSQYIYVTEDWDTDTWDTDPDTWQKRHLTTMYSLVTSSSSILWWAAAILMLNLYCVCCKCRCSPVVAVFFIIGGIMQAVTAYDEIYIDCRSDPDDSDSDKADIGYCKVSYIAVYLWIVLFSFYLAMDTMFSIGDNIRTRIFVKSFIICIRSFLIFLIYNYYLQRLIQEEHNDNLNPDSDHAEKFDYRSGISSNFSLSFWCLVLMIIVAMGYGEKDSSNKRLNIWVRRIIGWFMIGSTGASLIHYFFVYGGVDLYWLPGAVLLVYDLQYL